MRFTKTIASASVAAVIGLGGVSVAGATSGDTTPKPATTATTAAAPNKAAAEKPALKALRRRIRRGAGTIVAKTIGIKPAELAQELRAGKTIATVATDHGVQPQAVISALESAATAKIEAAKAAGKISAGRATKLEARIDRLVPKLVDNWHPRPKTAG